MWKKTMLTRNSLWVDDTSQANYSNLKALFRRNIDNDNMIVILNEVFDEHKITNILEWTLDNSNEDVNFF